MVFKSKFIKNWMLQKNFSLFYLKKYFSWNSRNAVDDDRKTWFNMKKFIYDSITLPGREIAFTTQLNIWHCNAENTDLQRLYMNIGVDGWSKDDVSRMGSRVEILRLVSVSTLEAEANVWRRLRECEKRFYKCSAFIVNSLLVIENCTYYRFPLFRGWGDGQLYRNTLSWFS